MLFEEDTLPVPPVRKFELDRYLGRWYEIARLPHYFERGLESVYADYYLENDELRIRSHGIRDGKVHEVTGSGRFKESSSLGELIVHFFAPWHVDLDYRIIFLDSEYRYSVVGTPNRSHIWFLARNPVLSMRHVEILREFARFHGYDTDALEYPRQPRTPVIE